LPTYQRDRTRLADELKHLRQAAGLSGARLAERLGWVQSKVSKIETLKQLPTEDDVRAWASHVGASPDAVEELLQLLRRARVEYAAWKESYQEVGVDGVQADILAYESRASRLAEFQPGLVPGLLHTADYARELLHLPGVDVFTLDEASIDRMIATRMRRQQVLYEREKSVQIVMLEGALRARVCSPDTLAGQMDRLLAISGLSSLELGVIPFEAPLPIWPVSGFRLYDRDLVVVETISGEQHLSDPDEVANYERWLDLLRAAALHGRDAAQVIQRALVSAREGGAS